MLLPSLGEWDLYKALVDLRGFASNITASYASFGNVPHYDGDIKELITTGFWFTTKGGYVSDLSWLCISRLVDSG